MKVSFSCELTRSSGKQIFVCRLCESLKRKGIKITDKNPNINVVIVKGSKSGCKNILRLDGVWMNSTDKDLQNKNSKIRNLIKSCDGVIYQNQFCKDASDKIIQRSNDNFAIIGNGIDPAEVQVESNFQNSKPFFLAMCKWRPHKRYKDIVNGFLNSGLKSEYDLIVFGEPEKRIQDNAVKHFGNASNKNLLEALSKCVGTAHLAYVDWCPNSVVESIIAKKPVLHTDSGGTKIIVKNDGICIKEKKSWDFSVINLYDPPALHVDEIGQGFRDLLKVKPVGERLDLHIDTIADQYIQFFRKTLE